MMLVALLFLCGATLVGVGVTRRVLRGVLTGVESMLAGAVFGCMLATICAYLAARLTGRISGFSLLLLSTALFVLGVWLTRRSLADAARRLLNLPHTQKLAHTHTAKTHNSHDDVNDAVRWRRWRRSEFAPVVALCLLFAPVYIALFSTRMFQPKPDGLYSGGNSWNDMSLHLAITTAFLHADNFPPAYTPFAGEPLRYPFLPDFLTAVLMQLGLSSWVALVVTALPLAFAITGLAYCFALRILERRRAAMIAAVLFLMNGGLGFLYFFEDWRASNKPLGEFWNNLQVNYANLWDRKIFWANIIVDMLVPGRASLFGVPTALTAFLLFAVVWRRWAGNTIAGGSASSLRLSVLARVFPNRHTKTQKRIERKEAKRITTDAGAWDGWRELLAAGVVTGMLPLFHTHSYMAIGLVSGFLFLLKPRRVWLAFWLPAVLLAVPQLTSIIGHVGERRFMYWQPGWKGHWETNQLLFWLRNIGVPLLLLVPAWLAAPRMWRKFYLAFAALMLFCGLVMVSPHDYDNIKLMYYWYAATCILIAGWLVKLAGAHRQSFLAVVLALLCVLSAVLSIKRETLIVWRVFSNEEIKTADYVRRHTEKKARFLTAPIHNQPLLCLAGRSILLGFHGWIIPHGYDYKGREADLKAIYAGGAEADRLLAAHKIDFIYLSPTETATLKVNADYLNRTFPIFYRNGNITIYDARTRLAESNAKN